MHVKLYDSTSTLSVKLCTHHFHRVTEEFSFIDILSSRRSIQTDWLDDIFCDRCIGKWDAIAIAIE